MRKNHGRKYLVVLIVAIFGGASIIPGIGAINNQAAYQQKLTQQTTNINIAVTSNAEITTLEYQIDTFDLNSVVIDNNKYVQVTVDSEPNSLDKGMPDLPAICRSIIIPDSEKMNVRVIESSYEEYENIQLAPSKGNILRTVNPSDVPYEFADIYAQNTWYPTEIALLSEPYILRDFRGQVVRVTPFQYNPVEGKLRFYTDITVEVYSVGTDTMNCLARSELPLKVDIDFLQIYDRHFVNFNQDRYTPVGEQGNMLVITYDAFYDEMIPFVQWKNLKGIPTEMVNVSTIGNANAIKSYIANYYTTNGLTFVLLAGDVAQVPTLQSGYGASDPSYAYIVGGDHYADICVGRFSAETPAQVVTQVARTITYERDPQEGAEWYTKGLGIASDQGPGDDNEMDYEHIRNVRTKLMNYHYTVVDELYDGNQGGQDAPGYPTPSMVATSLNAGRTIINYCGHGSMVSWGSSDFQNSDVNALTNDNMLPFICSVACNNGEFDSGTCFGEAWLRATHNDQPVGAIGAFMSAVSQSWDPPMCAQDEAVDILVETYETNIKTTFGALMFNGCLKMNDEYGAEGIEETDAWTVFGDPSVQVRTDTPFALTCEHATFLEYGATTFEVEVPGVANALCAISKEYQTLGYGYTDATGHAVIEFFEPLAAEDTVELMVTGYNAIPYQTTIFVGEPNQSPGVPAKPTGPAQGEPGTNYLYRTSTTDPDGDPVLYQWDWGDGNYSEWLGPFTSGQVATALHAWDAEGSYAVRVKAKDVYGAETDWSAPLDITMPTSVQLFILHHFPRLGHFLESIQQLFQ